MEFDLKASTVKLGGRHFPAVGLLCPPVEGHEEPPDQRLLGGPSIQPNPAQLGPRVEVYVPAENGVLIELSQYEVRRGGLTLSIHLYARTCTLIESQNPLWLPQRLSVFGGRIARETDNFLHSGWWAWDNAEPEWACEHIDRLSKMAYDQPDGPQVELINLAKAWQLMETLR
jgi:hypothetical protein